MQKSKIPNGLTLAELVIVLVIIGILFGAGTRSYIQEKERFAFTNSLQEIISLIKTAREYALTSRAAYSPNRLDDPDTPLNEKMETHFVPAEGYGVLISRSDVPGASELILFANTSPFLKDPLRDQKINQFDAADLIEKRYLLPKVTIFEALLKNDKNTILPGNEALILFRPPLASAFIGNNQDPTKEVNRIDTLYMRIFSRAASAKAKKKFILINKTAGFPELEL